MEETIDLINVSKNHLYSSTITLLLQIVEKQEKIIDKLEHEIRCLKN